MEAQGYHVQANVLLKDNKSATILLEKNSKTSSSKQRSISASTIFFIRDQVKEGDMSLVWCPTGDMIGDYMTKSLQGALFRKFRDQLMGVILAQYPGPGKPKLVQNVKPWKGKTEKGLVPLKKERHPRNVLGVATNDGRSDPGCIELRSG